MRVATVFPMRLLGFGFYWAWLFLVTLSSSPVFAPVDYAGLPSELIEVLFRLVFVIGIFLAGDRLSTQRGRAILLIACCVGGPLSTILASVTSGPLIGVFALALLGLADAATFVLWLCFFGHMRVGETALYMVLSYCLGGLLCLGVSALGGQGAIAASALFLVASGAMFYLSNKLYAGQTGTEELFSSDHAIQSESDVHQRPYEYLKRLGFSLGCCAFAFGCTSSAMYFGFCSSLLPASLVESACCIVLAAVCGMMMFATKQSQDLCVLYKIVPLLLVIGVFLMLCEEPIVETAGAAFVNLGYLVFEVTALNDYCIAAKSRALSLIRTFSTARIAITGGLAAGWILVVAVNAAGLPDAKIMLFGVSLVVFIAASTIVFTDKQIAEARKVASVQEQLESAEDARLDRATKFPEDVARFASAHQLTRRESEIAELVLRGRNVSYIAEQLCLAPGTVKTHMHNIYSKVDVHTKMEFLDAFESLREQR